MDPISSGTVFVALFLVVAAYLSYFYLVGPRGVPPGPLGLPILGYFPFLSRHPPAKLAKLGEKYGGIMSLYLGSRFVVVLNSAEVLKEAYVKQAETFSGRPRECNTMIATVDKSDELNLSFHDGRFYQDHRRFALKILHDCGLGKSSLDQLVMDETQHFISALKANNGAPFDLRAPLASSVTNNIFLMVLGRRFDYNDKWLLDIQNNVNVVLRGYRRVGIAVFLPWFKRIPGIVRLTKQQETLEANRATTLSLAKLVADYKDKCADIEDRGNYINAFIAEQKARKLIDPSDETFSDDVLIANIKMFIVAGTKTTSKFVSLLILHMMAYPEVQSRMQREIDDVIGTERVPSCQDQALTPYTQAVIAEVQRMSGFMDFSLPNRNKVECYIRGYRIPKDSFIMSNVWGVHNNAADFPEPDQFRPEHFLNEQGQFVKHDNFFPFGLGKRQCMGEPLGRTEIYLYVTAMLQTFSFRFPEDVIRESFDMNKYLIKLPEVLVTRAILRR